MEVDFRRVLRRHYKGRRNSSEKPIPKAEVCGNDGFLERNCNMPQRALLLRMNWQFLYRRPWFHKSIYVWSGISQRNTAAIYPSPGVQSPLMAPRVNYRRYANGILNRSHSVGPLLCLFKAWLMLASPLPTPTLPWPPPTVGFGSCNSVISGRPFLTSPSRCCCGGSIVPQLYLLISPRFVKCARH